ncbi:hypothetical protein REH65_32200 [Saccharopolyspora sp. ID03-671]|uniref:esterase/lipase family protein n=1 Tax=Saccharopolyspora sp. ID03-671 TaxID=3073066 RepID=UPI0032443669
MLVPGLLGSALHDTVTGDTIWGLEPRWLVRMLSRPSNALEALKVTDEERDGRTGRVVPSPLKYPAFLPGFGGLPPYRGLLRSLREGRRPETVREFSYDWRLPVAHNAGLLAKKVDELVSDLGNPRAEVVLVAHSMGGLLCQHLHTIPGAVANVRNVVTLGTPFGGAAKAAAVLGGGTEISGPPWLREELRQAAVTMPGLYDLLPTYRCVVRGHDLTRLTASDIAGLGGDAGLAANALRTRTELRDTLMTGHHALLGVEQPTVSSLDLTDGTVHGLPHTYVPVSADSVAREPDGTLTTLPGLGDGTVPRNASLPAADTARTPVALQHLPMASADVAITITRDIVVHGKADFGPRLGAGDLGMRVPDVVTPQREWAVELTEADPMLTTVRLINVATATEIPGSHVHRRSGVLQSTVTVPTPGLYEVRVEGGGDAVTQYVLAEDPHE